MKAIKEVTRLVVAGYLPPELIREALLLHAEWEESALIEAERRVRRALSAYRQRSFYRH